MSTSSCLELGRICSERVRAISQVQERIKLLCLQSIAIVEILQKTYAALVSIGMVVLFWFEVNPPTQKQYNNQMLPPTRLGFFFVIIPYQFTRLLNVSVILFVWYFVNQALDQVILQMELISNKQSAQKVFDKFFSTDVLIESNQITESSGNQGSLMIRDCEMFDRIPENFSEVIVYLLGQDNNKLKESLTRKDDSKYFARPSRTLVGKDESKKQAHILKRVAPRSVSMLWDATERIREVDTRILGISELQEALTRQETKSPVRAKLRKIFGKLDLEILPGEKICVIEDKTEMPHRT